MYLVHYSKDYGEEIVPIIVFVTPCIVTATNWVNKFNKLLAKVTPIYEEEYNKWMDSDDPSYQMPKWAGYRSFVLRGVLKANFSEIDVR